MVSWCNGNTPRFDRGISDSNSDETTILYNKVMKVEKRESGITLVPESDFEIEALKTLRSKLIKKMHFEDEWESKGKFYIDFDTDWGR